MPQMSYRAIDQFQACLSLAADLSRHAEAKQAFSKLHNELATDHPFAAQMLELAWNEVLAAKRSAGFWERISNAERQMTEQMAASHVQLQQNYLRLIQEQ
ncbi:MAG TPA: hypothetical protein V6D10_09420 [Trichocoleus sp.]